LIYVKVLTITGILYHNIVELSTICTQNNKFFKFCIPKVYTPWGNLSVWTRACGGKLSRQSLAKNFKTLIFIKQNLIMSRCEHEQSESGARLCESFTLDPKVFGKV